MGASRGTPLFALLLALPAAAQDPTPAQALAGLREDRPRLYFGPGGVARLRERLAADAGAKELAARLLARARSLRERPVVAYRVVGGRLLQESRGCLERLAHLGLAWLLTGEEPFLARGRAELRAACALPDWHPAHFLDTAEMAHAVALGLDWLHAGLPEEERRACREALLAKGLGPGLEGARKKAWWTRTPYNWNHVCSGGLGVAALGIAGEAPGPAGEMLAAAVRQLRPALATWGPDGAWEEGPGYWHYAMAYTVAFLACLESARGGDFGLAAEPALARAGRFVLHAAGPSGLCFNFGDSSPKAGGGPELLWLGTKYEDPLLIWMRRSELDQGARPAPWDLLWWGGAGKGPAALNEPLHAAFRRLEAAFLRTAWGDPAAAFVALKAGANGVNHGHLDLGAFVLDALGRRWVHDLGPEDYNVPGYWQGGKGGSRWSWLRCSARGHGVLLPAGADQDPVAVGRIIACGEKAGRRFAVADLTAAYPGRLAAWTRGAALLPGGAILVQDEWRPASSPPALVWQVFTDRPPEPEGAAARLQAPAGKDGGAGPTLAVQILEPAGAVFAAEPVQTRPPEKPAKGLWRLHFSLPPRAGEGRAAVLFVPAGPAAAPPAVVPLASW